MSTASTEMVALNNIVVHSLLLKLGICYVKIPYIIHIYLEKNTYKLQLKVVFINSVCHKTSAIRVLSSPDIIYSDFSQNVFDKKVKTMDGYEDDDDDGDDMSGSSEDEESKAWTEDNLQNVIFFVSAFSCFQCHLCFIYRIRTTYVQGVAERHW